MTSLNPIEVRLERLRSQWQVFEKSHQARLLHWVIEPGDLRMFEAFLEMEGHEDSDNPDLFVQLDTPFDSAADHGIRLTQVIEAYYAELRESLIEEGLVDARWAAPTHEQDDPGGCQTLAAAAESFRRHHQPLFRNLVLVLTPHRVASTAAWAGWIEHMLEHVASPQWRLVVVEQSDELALAGVAAKLAEWVSTVRAELDMASAIEEISTQAGRLDQPDGAFRHLFVQLGNTIGLGDMEAAVVIGDKALAIATEQGWVHLAIAVRFAVAAGWLGAQKPLRALEEYGRAEQVAITAPADDAGLVAGLRVKVRMARGAALIAAGAFDKAASCYADTAPLAVDLGDALMTLESHRMASYAYECAEAWQDAWDAGLRTLATGEAMEETERRQSTLPFVGEAMLRLTTKRQFSGYRDAIDERMCDLIGADWRERAQPLDPPLDPRLSEGQAP